MPTNFADPALVTDLAVVAILLISGLLAFARGFSHEVLSVAAWVAAAFASLYAFPYAQPLAREAIAIPIIADAVAGAGVFIVTLFLFSLLTNSISGPIRRSAFNPLDRSLGFVFGLFRGAVLVSLAYLVLGWMIPPNEQPTWLRSAKTMPLISNGADILRRLIPDNLRHADSEQSSLVLKQRQVIDSARKVQEAERALRGLSNPPATTGGPDTDGYRHQERSDMDRLIQSNQ